MEEKCDCEFDTVILLDDYKKMFGYVLIKGKSVLKSECKKCGKVINELCTGGYFEEVSNE